MMPVRVLFVCVHNAARSQMAEAFANRLGKGLVEAKSAGTQPSDTLEPAAVRAMEEVGYDISMNRPKHITAELREWADKIITMGCGVSEGATCPFFAKSVEDWGLDDPHGRSIEEVRAIRDEIERRVRRLVDEISSSNHISQ